MNARVSPSIQVSRNHHFVPKFLLEPWLVGSWMHGYYWNGYEERLGLRRKGAKAFCSRLDLLSLQTEKLGRDALERLFFGEVDTRGAVARDILFELGVRALSDDQRRDFVRLLISLDMRRPAIIDHLRTSGPRTISEGLDNDPKIIAAMKDFGLAEKPSELAQKQMGMSFEDRALLILQKLVDNPEVGRRFLNSHWDVIHAGTFAESFVLSDRPLIRLYRFDDRRAVLALPLSPHAVFVAANELSVLNDIRRYSPGRLVKNINVLSARQVDQYLFCIDSSHDHWIGRYLREARRRAGKAANIQLTK